jgi:hypothetical protein
MNMLPFDRKLTQRGDLLAWTSDPTRRLLFKFMGHGSDVVATWLEPRVGRPNDVICRQRDVLRVVG